MGAKNNFTPSKFAPREGWVYRVTYRAASHREFTKVEPSGPLPRLQEEMFTSLLPIIMPLNGWKIAQVGGGSSDSSRLITALVCSLLRGSDTPDTGWGSVEEGMSPSSWGCGGDSGRGTCVFSSFIGSVSEVVLGSDIVAWFGSQSWVGTVTLCQLQSLGTLDFSRMTLTSLALRVVRPGMVLASRNGQLVNYYFLSPSHLTVSANFIGFLKCLKWRWMI